MKGYIRVAERRWDLRLENGITVKLPENGEDAAIAEVLSAGSRGRAAVARHRRRRPAARRPPRRQADAGGGGAPRRRRSTEQAKAAKKKPGKSI